MDSTDSADSCRHKWWMIADLITCSLLFLYPSLSGRGGNRLLKHRCIPRSFSNYWSHMTRWTVPGEIRIFFRMKTKCTSPPSQKKKKVLHLLSLWASNEVTGVVCFHTIASPSFNSWIKPFPEVIDSSIVRGVVVNMVALNKQTISQFNPKIIIDIFLHIRNKIVRPVYNFFPLGMNIN